MEIFLMIYIPVFLINLLIWKTFSNEEGWEFNILIKVLITIFPVPLILLGSALCLGIVVFIGIPVGLIVLFAYGLSLL